MSYFLHFNQKNYALRTHCPDVAHWIPPAADYVCTYVQAWVTVKHFYALTIDSVEKTALISLLANC